MRFEPRRPLKETEERVVESLARYPKTSRELADELGMASATLNRVIRRLSDGNYVTLHSKKVVDGVTTPFYTKVTNPEKTGDVRKVRIRPAIPGDSPMRADTAAAWLKNEVIK
jgi:predicted transcriptional regulator